MCPKRKHGSWTLHSWFSLAKVNNYLIMSYKWKCFFHENYLKIFFSIKQERCRPIHKYYIIKISPLNAELNPFSHLLALLGAHHILNVSRVRVTCINFDFNINNLNVAKYCTRVCSTLLFITIFEIWAPGFKYDKAGILPLKWQQNECGCLKAMQDNFFLITKKYFKHF